MNNISDGDAEEGGTYRKAIHQFFSQNPAATLNRGTATRVMTGATVSGPIYRSSTLARPVAPISI